MFFAVHSTCANVYKVATIQLLLWLFCSGTHTPRHITNFYPLCVVRSTKRVVMIQSRTHPFFVFSCFCWSSSLMVHVGARCINEEEEVLLRAVCVVVSAVLDWSLERLTPRTSWLDMRRPQNFSQSCAKENTREAGGGAWNKGLIRKVKAFN